MVMVRDFLNPLGRDALVRLCQLRGLRRARSNDERKSLLAYSYRGDIAALIADMYKYELVVSLKYLVVTEREGDFALHRPEQYDLEKLRGLARQSIVGTLGDEWRLLNKDDPATEQYDEEDDDTDDSESVDISATWSDIVRGDIQFGVWSRPRKVSRLLNLAGLGFNQRLSTPRFRDLLLKLKSSGLEASLCDDGAVLVPELACTPGLQAKLRLRRIGREISATLKQDQILSVRFHGQGKKNLTTALLASLLLDGKPTTELCIVSAYYDVEWIRDLVGSIGKGRLTSIKLVYNGLGGRRLYEQRNDLCSLVDEFPGMEVRLAFVPGIFHSKLFFSSSAALVGSANATSAAFTVNEEILFPVDVSVARKYFDDVWGGATGIRSNEIDDRSAARSLVGFFRAGSLFFKPQVQIGYTYNPYSEWLRGLALEDRQRLSGGFQSDYAEAGLGIGAFSFIRAADLEESSEGRGRPRAKFSIKPYAVETTLGYWVPEFYVEEVERRVRELGESRREVFKQQAEQLERLDDNRVVEKFKRYCDDVDEFIRKNGLNPPGRCNQLYANNQRPPVLRLYDGLIRRLKNDNFLGRLCDLFVSSGMPEIWDDEVVADEFIESFFEYVSLEKNRHVPKQIVSRFGDGINGVGDEVDTQKINDCLRKNPWRRDCWKPTTHTDLVDGAEEDSESVNRAV